MANVFKVILSKQLGTAGATDENNAVTVGTDASTPNGYVVQKDTTATVIGMSIANVLLIDVKVDVMVYDGSRVVYINKNSLIPPGASLVVVGGDQKLVLPTGYSMKVRANFDSSVDVVMSILELSAGSF